MEHSLFQQRESNFWILKFNLLSLAFEAVVKIVFDYFFQIPRIVVIFYGLKN